MIASVGRPVEPPEHRSRDATVSADDIGAPGEITAQGIEPSARETCDNDVRKVTTHDVDATGFGFGGAPV